MDILPYSKCFSLICQDYSMYYKYKDLHNINKKGARENKEQPAHAHKVTHTLSTKCHYAIYGSFYFTKKKKSQSIHKKKIRIVVLIESPR